MDTGMGPQSSMGPRGGQRLTKEDQQDRLLHFQRVREDGSPEDDIPIQDGSQGNGSIPNQDDSSAGPEEQAPQNSVSPQTCADSSSRNPSESSQGPAVEHTKQNQDPGSENFNLTDSHSSFILSTPQVSSHTGSATEGCGSCHPKPLSSTVSAMNSRTTLSLEKVSIKEDQTENLNEDASKQLEGNDARSSCDDKRSRQPSECRTETASQRPYGSLVSKENFSSVGEAEGDSDEEEEFHDVLILCDSADEKHLEKFKEICEKNNWTTMTKDEFPSGAYHFQQLQEEVENCTLVVPLLTSHSLNHEQSKMEQHAALFSSLRENYSPKFVPVVCEDDLKLPDFMVAITPGRLYSPVFEKQLKKTMKRQKKNKLMGCKNLPMNPLGGSTGNGKGSAQSAQEESPTQVFRGLQDNLSPGPNAQRFVVDVRFRELCLVLDLPDPLGTFHWQRLADHLGLTSQEINWQNEQRRCASSVLEFYFYLHRRESVEKVLCNLMEICETKLGHVQARNILAQEIEEQRTVFKNRTKGSHKESKDRR